MTLFSLNCRFSGPQCTSSHDTFLIVASLDERYIGKLGSVRCRRFAMLVENNIITVVKVEQPSGSGAPTCSFAEDVLKVL